jgi:acetyltransferase
MFTDTLHEAAPTYRIHRYPSALIDRLTLRDGRSVTLRPILPQDADAEQAFVSAMSPASRYRRFHQGISELSEGLLREFTQIDYRTHLALVAESSKDDDGTLVADARYVVNEDGTSADFAIAVADSWQGLGLGSELMQRLLRHARRAGLARLCGDVLSTNESMLGLMRRLQARITPDLEDASLQRVCFAL